jgi:hypothetical protein
LSLRAGPRCAAGRSPRSWRCALQPSICNSTHMLLRRSFFAVDRVNFPANNPEASLLRNRRYLSVKGLALGAEIDDTSTSSTSSFTLFLNNLRECFRFIELSRH